MSSAKEALDGDCKSQKLPFFIKQEQESKNMTWKGMEVWLNMAMPMIMLSLLTVSAHNTTLPTLEESLSSIIAIAMMNCGVYMFLGFLFASSFLKLESEDRNMMGKWPLALWILFQSMVSTN